MLKLSFIGPFQARWNGDPVEITSKRARIMLTALALSPDGRVSRSRLAALLWPDRGDEQARSSLRQELSALRRALGPDADICLHASKDAIALDRNGSVTTDLWTLDGQSLGRMPAGQLLEDEPAVNDAVSDWLETERRNLSAQRCRLLETALSQPALPPQERIDLAQRLQQIDPYCEGAVSARMNALNDLGRTAEALATYQDYAERLSRDLDLSPSAGLAALRAELNHLGNAAISPAIEENDRKIFDRPDLLLTAFDCLSDDPGDGLIASGLVEDIRANLSHWRWFPVIGPEVIGWKTGRDMPLRDMAEQVGARYVVTGSMRQAAGRIRIVATLTDVEDGHTLWTQTFDGTIDDIFDFQEQVSRAIVARIEPEISHAEAHRVRLGRPRDLEAWQLVAQTDEIDRAAGGGYGTEDSNAKQIPLLQEAIAREPGHARAWARLSKVHWRFFLMGWSDDRDASMQASLEASQKAISLDPQDWEAHAYQSLVQIFGRHDYSLGRHHAEEAVRINPCAVLARHALACGMVWSGDPEPAISHLELIFRLNPNHPNRPAVMGEQVFAHMLMGDLDKAVELARQMVSLAPNYLRGMQRAAAVYGLAGESQLANEARESLLSQQPEFSESYVRATYPFRKPEHLEMVIEGLRKAGCLGA